MKIIKNSIAGLMMLLATHSMADNADLGDISQEQKLQQYTMVSSLHQLEQNLIREYLAEAFQLEVTMEKGNLIRIFNIRGELVYLGDSKQAKDLIDKSSHLFDHENTGYYLISE